MNTRRLLAAALPVFLAACAAPVGPQPQGVASAPAPAVRGSLKEMTVDQYIAALDGPPQTVGFDVDDTVYFSSPGYYWGTIEYGPGCMRDPARLDDPKERDLAERFWKRMNSELDRHDILKDSARRLVTAHHARGDTIVFITGRPDLLDGPDALAAKIAAELGLEKPVIRRTGSADKAGALRELHVALYYGDGKSDMEAAARAGARGVAVFRSPQSISRGGPAASSGPCEAVLTDSAN
jgi:acid phosphatase (class B)